MSLSNKNIKLYYTLRLLTTKGIGQKKAMQVFAYCKQKGLTLDEFFSELNSSDALPNFIARHLPDLRKDDSRLDEQFEKMYKNNIKALIFDEDEYPDKLLNALHENAPIILLYKGDINILKKPSVGFCGSRKASPKGIETARDCSDQLAQKGVNIVSGYAHGVDMTTHTAALQAGGVTTLVLAEGILQFRLKKEIEDYYDPERTLIVSEFLPGVPWNVRNAMQRNGTICGLSNLTILIEALDKGGSFNAGEKCLSMNRPLFAPVYKGMPETATGNRMLLDKGARSLMRRKSTGRAEMGEVFNILFNHDETKEKDNLVANKLFS